jgi:hypothetical protein
MSSSSCGKGWGRVVVPCHVHCHVASVTDNKNKKGRAHFCARFPVNVVFVVVFIQRWGHAGCRAGGVVLVPVPVVASSSLVVVVVEVGGVVRESCIRNFNLHVTSSVT